MKQNRQFEEILNICLERMLRGQTVEQCLRDYPEQAVDLKPLLQTALAAKAASAIQPRSEFKARARDAFQDALRQRNAVPQKSSPFSRWRRFLQPLQLQPAWSIALVVLVVVVLSGGGTIAASRDSMPDNPLYNVKLFTENTRLTFAFSDNAKAELNAEFARNRGQEIVYAAANNDVENVRNATGNLSTNMSNVAVLTGNTLEKNAAQNNIIISKDMAAAAQNSAIQEGTLQDNAVLSEKAVPPQFAPMAAPAPGAADSTPAATGAVDLQEPRPASRAGLPDEQVAAEPDGTTTATADSPEPLELRHSYGLSKNGSAESATTEEDKLRRTLTENYLVMQYNLEEALKTASPDIRPVIRQAIAQAQAEYQKAMSNLEILNYINKRE